MNRSQLLQSYHDRIDRGVRQKLTTAERDFLVQDFIHRLQSLESAEAIELLCQQEIALLEAGYGEGTNSTVNYLSRYRTAIAQATQAGKLPLTEETSYAFSGRKAKTGEPIESLNHLAFDLMRYDNSVYLANRKATNVGNNARQDNPQPFDPDRFLEKATELLRSEEPETLAVGIAAVTGRRHTEVAVSGRFTLTHHPYVLTFDGQLKKEAPVAYTIATLLPAQQVMQAIDRFRTMPQVQALAGLSSEDQLVKSFRARVNTRVKQHFQKTQILPLLPGFQSVSVHRLRGAYARMIIHHWLPNQGANEQRFLQFYLGHVEAADMKDAFNAGSTTHYFGYRLEKHGKRITASGIKLMAHPPLPSPTQQQLDQQQQANDRFVLPPEADRLDAAPIAPHFSPKPQQTMSPTQSVVAAIAHDLQDLPEKKTQLSSISPQPFTPDPTESPRKPKRSKPRYRQLRVNLSDLQAAADHLNVSAPSQSDYQSLLDRLLLSIPRFTTTDQASPDPHQLLAPLLQELAAIKLQVSVGQAGEELEQLRQQNQQQQQQIDQLLAELKQANDRLAQIAAAAQGLAGMQPTPVAQPAPTQQTASLVAPIQQQPIIRPPALTPRPTSGRPPAAKLSPADRVPLAIAALMRHNQLCPPHDRWFLSGNVIASAAGANPALVVTPWLQNHPAAVNLIDHHNTAIGLNSRSNGKNKDRGHLKSIYQQFVGGKSLEELQQIVQQFDQQTD